MIRNLLIFMIRVYQYAFSPLLVGLGVRCRFYPSCSCYAVQAITYYGLIKGSLLTTLRLLNCHPFSKRNWFDPIPCLSKPSQVISDHSQLPSTLITDKTTDDVNDD